jgi:hypothetical protein
LTILEVRWHGPVDAAEVGGISTERGFVRRLTGKRRMVKIILIIAACMTLGGCFGLPGPVAALSGGVPASSEGTGVDYGGTKPSAGLKETPRRTVAVAKAVPSLRVDGGCKTAAALADSAGYENCISQEQVAKEQLTRDWEGYSVAERQECVPGQSDGLSQSYVEMMTCLEVQEWAKHPESIGGVTGKTPSPNTNRSAASSTDLDQSR